MRPPRYTPKLQAHVEGEVYADSLAPKIHNVQSAVFKNRWPHQLEQCQRLVTERLQACLNKSNSTDLTNPATWTASPDQLLTLAQTLSTLMALTPVVTAQPGSRDQDSFDDLDLTAFDREFGAKP